VRAREDRGFAFLAGQGEDLGAMRAIKRGINCNEKTSVSNTQTLAMPDFALLL